MSFFFSFFQLFIDFIIGIFNKLNTLSFVYEHNGLRYTIPYGWLLISALLLVILTNMFWRGGQK